MFVHNDVWHLVSNVVVQLFLGIVLELVHGWWRVALVYLAGVLAGSLGTSILNPTYNLVGASGGVYALITAHIATILMNWSEMKYAIVQLYVFLVVCSTDICFSLYSQYNNLSDKVGHNAHLCGALAGILVGIGVLRNLKELNFERKLWWFSVILYTILIIGAICFHLIYGSYFKTQTTRTPIH